MNMSTWVEQWGESALLAIGGLVIGLCFGFFAQRSRFCLRAAVIEFWHRKFGEKLSVWLLSFSAAVVGVQVLILMGALDVSGARQFSSKGSVSGALIGSAVAVDDASDRASVLDQMMQSIPNGATSLIATVGEYAPEVINGLITNLGGSVLRRPLAVVKAEVDAHSEAQAAAAKEARRVLRTKQGDEWHDKFDNWKEELGEGFDKLKNKLEQAFSSKK